MDMLTIKDLTFSYDRKGKLIEVFSMHLDKGSVCGLLGKNGAGKSTLLYLICGLLHPCGGSIRFNGYAPADRDTSFLEDIYLVPEEFSLPKVGLEDYIRVNAPLYPRFDRGKMDEYLGIFGLESDMNLGKLSMGQKKKFLMSFAMACDTSLLILDEPTNGLDITAKRCFRSALARCMDDEKTILISTHQVHDVSQLLDRVMIMDRSGVLLDRSTPEISEKLAFAFTTDRQRAADALISLDVPGGYNIAERVEGIDDETEVNLETLFELTTSDPSKVKEIFE